MMDRLTQLKSATNELKDIYASLFQKHMDDIISGHFLKTMMEDWDNDDKNLLAWRAATEILFEKT
jgi:ketol-acid reductoisomerase